MTQPGRTLVGVSEAIDLMGFGRFQVLLGASVGMAFIADAVEMLLLSILGPALACQWGISDYQQASLSTVVFMGMLFGSPAFGVMADKFGRRVTLIAATSFLLYFGVLTTFSPTFEWILFLRFCCGFYIGAVPQACTLLVEYMPSKYRGKGVMMLAFCWALGGVLLALTAWVIMPLFGWRALVGLSALPLAVFLFTSPWCPESPLYLATTGKETEVYTQINRVAWANGQKEFFDTHELALSDSAEVVSARNRGNFLDLFQRDRLKLTLTVLLFWFVSAATYYGAVLLGTTMLDSSNNLCHDTPTNTSDSIVLKEDYCSLHTCVGLTKDDYVKILWTTMAEFPGTLLAIAIVDVMGRKLTIIILFIIYSAAVVALAGCSIGKGYLLVALFLARGTSAGVFQVIYLYTPEVYPTNLRAAAMGGGSSFARVGAMVTPFIANVMVKKSLGLAVSMYAIMGLVAALVAFLFLTESKNVDLSEAGNFNAPVKSRLNDDEASASSQ